MSAGKLLNHIRLHVENHDKHYNSSPLHRYWTNQLTDLAETITSYYVNTPSYVIESISRLETNMSRIAENASYFEAKRIFYPLAFFHDSKVPPQTVAVQWEKYTAQWDEEKKNTFSPVLFFKETFSFIDELKKMTAPTVKWVSLDEIENRDTNNIKGAATLSKPGLKSIAPLIEEIEDFNPYASNVNICGF